MKKEKVQSEKEQGPPRFGKDSVKGRKETMSDESKPSSFKNKVSSGKA